MLPQRFWDKVRVLPNGCWVWEGALDGGGYGSFKLKGKTYRAHRLTLQEKLGRPIAPGFEACHTRDCLNKTCVNPAHLYEGTRSENMLDKEALGNGHHPLGEHNGRCRIPAVVVQQLLAAKGKMSASKAATYFGISKAQVCKIWNGQSRSSDVPRE